MTKPLKFLTTFEAADRLGVSPSTVLRMCKEGELKAIRPRRDYKIPETEVERMLAPVREREEA